MLDQRGRFLWKTTIISLLLLFVAVVFFYRDYLHDRQISLLGRTLSDTVEIHILSGTSLSKIADMTTEAGVPVTKFEFIQLARALEVNQSLQAGYYRFLQGATVETVLRNMAKGEVIVEKITFIEGKTFAEMRKQLEADLRLRKKLPSMSIDDIRQVLKIQEKNIEGLFLPDTYFFQPGDSDLSILKRAHERLQKTLHEQWEKREDLFFRSPYDALILASIVEKETGKAKERAIIASVFLNRLRKGIRLQADPTVIYGLGERFDGNLTRRHLREDTPYNTYVHSGLTPTPIALVGKAAIEAVLQPAKSDYYYFVATGDGGHYFSKSLREHNNAVNRYQRKK